MRDPPLWNTHFADSRTAVRLEGFLKLTFADDSNCTSEFAASTPKIYVRTKQEGCQAGVARGGAANRALFDAGKNENLIIPFQIHENHKIRKITCQNKENH